MGTFILTWNKEHDWRSGGPHSEVKPSLDNPSSMWQWPTGHRKTGIKSGDRAYLLQQGHTRGMLAKGHFTSPVFQDTHWSDLSRQANYALVEWDQVLPRNDMVPVDVLIDQSIDIDWSNVMSAGQRVSDEDAKALEQLWNERFGVFTSPEEEPASGTARGYAEGAISEVRVNRYERSPAARKACIEHYGTACQVCGMDFSRRYGPVGTGFIHVHHVVELSSIGESYEVDPVADLRPVCPNCHAMLHTSSPALGIDDLRQIIRKGD